MAGTHYRDLIAWQRAMMLVERVYHSTGAFPEAERYGLTNQLRRAAVSIPSNIAEGQARQAKADFRRFLRISRGSLAELETQLELAIRLKFLTKLQTEEMFKNADEVGRLISGLIRSQGDE